MIERESKLPLLLGSVFALLLHMALVPVWGIGLAGPQSAHDLVPPEEDKALPTAQEVEVGRAHASVTNIAWIAYDDFQELLARHSVVEQPALQRQEDPVPNAPIELDPTPPAPNSRPSDEPAPPGEDATDPNTTPRPDSPVGLVPLPSPQDDGQLPYAPDGPTPNDAQRVAEATTQPQQPSDTPTKEQPDSPGSPDSSARPTAAPRDTAESPPVTIIPGIIKVRPGAVLTADGIEIKTVIPRPSAIARYSTVPKDPTVDLWFSPEGKVTRVVITHSTGADNWDEPVRTALEQWTATGERVDELEGEIKLTVELLLRPR